MAFWRPKKSSDLDAGNKDLFSSQIFLKVKEPKFGSQTFMMWALEYRKGRVRVKIEKRGL